MTLEDFFTLTEMKDGLTAPSRVHELVAVMRKERDSAVKNIGDATRQWAAVASTISATENRDCLDLFIQLDGLLFIDRWLKDAQKHSNHASDSFVEESITALLRALEKLKIDRESSISSGIWITVNSLLDHRSLRIQDRARALVGRWKLDKAVDDVQSVEASHNIKVALADISQPDSGAVDTPLSKGSADLENNAGFSAGGEFLESKPSNGPNPERAEDVQIQTHNEELVKASEPQKLVARLPDPLTASVIPNSVQESPSLKEKSPTNVVGGATSTETQCLPVLREHITELESDGSKKPSNSPESDASSKVLHGPKSSSTEAVQSNADVQGASFCLNTTAFGNITRPISTSNAQVNDSGTVDSLNTRVFELAAKDSEFSSGTPQLSGKDGRSPKVEESGTPFSRMEDTGTADEHSSDGSDDIRDGSDISKLALGNRSPDFADRRRSGIQLDLAGSRRSDNELDYGIVDALEVARQVAQEVEREVAREMVDYREPSCSSSSTEKIIESGIRQAGSPDSINRKAETSGNVSSEDMPTRQNLSAETSPQEGGGLVNSDNLGNGAENGAQELESSQVTEVAESSQVTEVAQEREANTGKGLSGFDLNLEVCSDDMDRPLNPISAPISIVSASRPAAASGSPAGPLQFEGTLGWKGSAATSAFRPASPRRISDGDRTHETGGTSSGSKQRLDFLNFDLNVAEEGDEKVADVASARQPAVSSGLLSGESSLEVGPRRSERPNLDLNQLSNDGDAPLSDLRMEGQLFYPRNDHRSPSPASSSSSMQHPLRNFDLNDRPLFQNDSSDHVLYHGKPSQNVSAYGAFKPNDPSISIFGTRVELGSRLELERKDFIPQAPSLPNGKSSEPTMDANVARMGGVFGMVPTVSYTHPPVFGYNGLAPSPNMSISSAMYGPGGSIPYMVDSRGAPVMPQLLGSASAVPQFSQSPFIMSMAGAPLSLNGGGPPRPNFDLNSGFAIEGGGGTGGLRQLFIGGPGRPIEDHLRANLQPSSSSGVGVKRKEPDSGWEPYSLNYKHPQNPWR